MLRTVLTPLLFSGISTGISAQQYQLNGNAFANSCNCYTLTTQQTFQSGSAWNRTLFDLNNPFDFRFSVFLGCSDAAGADGMVFMLQQVSNSLGASGGGLGFEGVSPSIGIVLDTWQNTVNNDPTYDHISIQANGQMTHGSDLAGPVQASATSANIEDCQWHLFRITWDPVTQWIRAYFDGVLRVEAQVNLVQSIFNNNPLVYWGFSAATGGNFNLQQFCTALSPDFQTGFTNNATCIGTPVSFANTSESFAPITAYHWDFGDGTTSTLQNPPQHLYQQPGIYEVKLAVKGFDGCDSDTLKRNILISDYPVAGFSVYDTCQGKLPRIADESTVTAGTISNWSWVLDGLPVSSSQLPQLQGLAPGGHTLSLQVSTNAGCASANTATHTFDILPAPVIDFAGPAAGCVQQPYQFSGTQVDAATTIASWQWQFGDGYTTGEQNPIHSFNNPLNGTIQLGATATNGCTAEVVSHPVFINQVQVNTAGSDTLALRNERFQLKASGQSPPSPGGGQVSYSWEPAALLDQPASATTTGVIEDDQTFTVTATTPEGCTDQATAHVKLFKGSTIFVPTGFTPNRDGLNDYLRPYYIGIREVDYFIIYNRWGQPVYSTSDPGGSWDGYYKGVLQPNGVYIWRLRAIDFAGKVYVLDGTTTLIR